MYCTQEDLNSQVRLEVLIELTDDERTGAVNVDRLNWAMEGASDLIDSYAGARYPVPLSPVPNVINRLAVDIALYNLFSRRGFDPEKTADQSIVDRYKAAVAFLTKLAQGVVTIGLEPPAQNDAVTVKANDRVFGRDSLLGW